MKNYVNQNISVKSHATLQHVLKMLSGSSETIIFMFLGVMATDKSHWINWNFIIMTILFCTIFRAIGVLLLSGLVNRFRLHKLTKKHKFVMTYGGLRGAIGFALVMLLQETEGEAQPKVPHADMFLTTTIAVIFWTVFVQGTTIKPLVKCLKITGNKKDLTMNEIIHTRFIEHLKGGMEGITGQLTNQRFVHVSTQG